MKKQIQPAIQKQILSAYLKSSSLKEIAHKNGVSVGTISNIAKSHPVKRKLVVDEEFKKRVLTLYNQGTKAVDIAAILDCCRDTVGKTLRELGVDTSTLARLKSRAVQTNPFENLSSESTQYWLGWLAADGSIGTKGSVALTTKDKEIAEAFCAYLGLPKTKVYAYKDKRFSTALFYQVKFSNKEVAGYLTQLGITPKKSFTIKMQIPLTFAFFRGYFEGNGCVSKESRNSGAILISTASEQFADQLVLFLSTSDLQVHKQNSGKYFVVRIGQFSQLKFLYRLMYTDSNLFLERKRKKLEEILGIVEEIVPASSENWRD